MVCIQQSACQHERNERQSKAPGGKAAAALFPQQTGDGKHGSQSGGSHAERQAAAQHRDISCGKRAAAVTEPDAQQGGSQQRQHDDGQEKGRQARALFLSCGTVIALLYGSILHKTRSFREVLFCIISQEAAEGQYRYKKIAEEKASLLPRRIDASAAAAAAAAVVVGRVGAAAVISAAAEQQEQDDDPPAVAAEAIGIAIHSQEPPVWILSTRLIPCYDGGPQKCGRRDKKQEPLHQQRLWLCKKTGINSRDACSYEQLRTSASA